MWLANIPFSLLGEIIVGLLKASFFQKAAKYSQMPTRLSTGSTVQHPECHVYKMVTEKVLHMVKLCG